MDGVAAGSSQSKTLGLSKKMRRLTMRWFFRLNIYTTNSPNMIKEDVWSFSKPPSRTQLRRRRQNTTTRRGDRAAFAWQRFHYTKLHSQTEKVRIWYWKLKEVRIRYWTLTKVIICWKQQKKPQNLTLKVEKVRYQKLETAGKTFSQLAPTPPDLVEGSYKLIQVK